MSWGRGQGVEGGEGAGPGGRGPSLAAARGYWPREVHFGAEGRAVMEAALKVRRFCGDRTNIRDGNGCGAGWKVTG